MDPSELAKELTAQTVTRGDAVYLAVVVVVLCGVILIGAGYVMVKWMPAIVASFRDEMRLERDFHQKQIERLCKSVEQDRRKGG